MKNKKVISIRRPWSKFVNEISRPVALCKYTAYTYAVSFYKIQDKASEKKHIYWKTNICFSDGAYAF